MKGDHKSQDASKADPPQPQTGALASTSDRKLSVELPSSRQIYTVGSVVSGLVHLGTKGHSSIQEVHVSLVCIVSTRYHRYSGGTMHEVRHETSKLLHLDETLWSRADGDASDPPTTFSFHFTIPEFGNDAKAENHQARLPPSFHASSTGFRKMLIFTPIGTIKYRVRVSVARKGILKFKERAFCPIVFLPPSPPPPLLPTLPDNISVQDLDHLNDSQWSRDIEISNLHSGIFSSNGNAALTLWLPQVPSFPRLMRIPFIVRLILQTQHVKDTPWEEPPKAILPPPPHLDKASLHLKQNIRIHPRGAPEDHTEDHTKVFDKNATDNFLHGIMPQEGAWLAKKADVEVYWEKEYMWRGSWTFKEVPNFSNRQLTCKYELVAEIPIKGLRNSAKLVSRELDVSSGVTAGTNPAFEADMLELPPEYFNAEDSDDDDDDKKS